MRGWCHGLHETFLFSSVHAEIAEGNDSDWLNGGDVDVHLKPEKGHFDVNPTMAKGSDAELKRLRPKAKSGLHLASMVFCNSVRKARPLQACGDGATPPWLCGETRTNEEAELDYPSLHTSGNVAVAHITRAQRSQFSLKNKSTEALARALSQLVVRGQPAQTIGQSSKMFLSPVATFDLAHLTIGLEFCQEALHSSLQRLLRRIHQLKRAHPRVDGLLEVNQFLYLVRCMCTSEAARNARLPYYSLLN